MLKKIAMLVYLALLAPLMFSCLGPISVGYLKMEPDIDITKKKFQYPLRIVLGSKIQDKFTIQGSVRNIDVDDYRKTVADLFVPALENNYREVAVAPMEQNKGVELLLNRVEPYQVQEPDGIRIGIRLHAELLKDGIPKGEIKGQYVSDFKAVTIFQLDQTMQSALQKMMRGFYDNYINLVNQLQL